MLCNMDGGIVREDWIGLRKSWMVVSRECWWRRCGDRRSSSCAGVSGVFVWVGLFALGTVITFGMGGGEVTFVFT
jgi:hypothetical protein